MTGASLLPLPVVFPIAGAVAAPLSARISRRLPLWVSAASLAASAAVLLLLSPTVFGGHTLTHAMGHWNPVRGAELGIMFTLDAFGLGYALACALIGLVLIVYTLSELGGLGSRELGGYAALFQLLLAALIGAALTGDLFNLFVWFEVAALASYGLTGFFLERPPALEAAFKILVLTTIASFGLFVGIGLLYERHGALNFAQLHEGLQHATGTADLVALGLLVAGFATKAGLVPFHGWLPDAHTAAPGPVSALFSGLMVNLGVFAIARLAFTVYGVRHLPILGVLMAFGLASALLGALMALAQDDLKRLLAYDTISQMGVITVGFATGSLTGMAGATYHLLNHALFKSLLFLCAGAVLHRAGATKLSEMGGLARHMPVIAVCFGVGTASIAGVPPFNGYVSLSLIHQGLKDGHQTVPLALMMVAQVITVAALGRAVWLGFFRRADQEHDWQEDRFRPGMAIGLGGLGACCVAFGVLPKLILDKTMAPAASALLDAQGYVRNALVTRTDVSVHSVPFHYADVTEILVTVGTLIVGGLLAWGYVARDTGPRLIRPLRAVHNGSVNDYAAYAVAGVLIVTLLLTW